MAEPKFLHLLVEGETEKRFTKTILSSHLATKGIYVIGAPSCTRQEASLRASQEDYVGNTPLVHLQRYQRNK